ncbi:serine/threonine-protein kinase pbs1 [Phtheirospermum japonicum]|uniref:Serine/threonine-protein kinase pbs1 n=1 Tax=Phtheirospermum japonicum TaxID=374723 RepID=A0A830BGY1_9LAMI|nr:serine/threonine-protein kinase pbs1 [Phtheirospermum japonicum]
MLPLLRHPNIASILGQCDYEDEHIIVQEHMASGTLYDRLHAHKTGQHALDWNMRMKIAVGVAKGLSYLHQEANPRVIHGNIVSSNVLIDDEGHPRISGFGHATCTAPDSDHTAFMFDTYSFGTWHMVLTGDPQLNGKFPTDILKAIVNLVALECLNEADDVRPDMAEVLDSLTYLTSCPYNPSAPKRSRLLLLSEELAT